MDYSIQNGWLDLPSEQELDDYLLWLNSQLPAKEAPGLMNFRKGVMNMYYQLARIKKVMEKV